MIRELATSAADRLGIPCDIVAVEHYGKTVAISVSPILHIGPETFAELEREFGECEMFTRVTTGASIPIVICPPGYRLNLTHAKEKSSDQKNKAQKKGIEKSRPETTDQKGREETDTSPKRKQAINKKENGRKETDPD